MAKEVRFCFESVFTRGEYEKFLAAVERRERYELYVGKYKDKIRASVHGYPCDNGCWLPDNYYWSISITDCRNGFSGSSSPFKVIEMKSYREIIDLVYDSLSLPRPTNFQQTFF